MTEYTKIRDGFYPLDWSTYVQNIADGPYFPSGNLGRKEWYAPCRVTGSKLPDHRDIIARRLPATTPLSVVDNRVISHVPLSWTMNTYDFFHYPELDRKIKSSDSGFEYPDPEIVNSFSGWLPMEDEAKAISLGAFNRKVQNFQSPFQTQVFAGELRETLKFIRAPLNNALKLTGVFAEALTTKTGKRTTGDIIIKQNKRLAKHLTKDISDLWLEYRFAVLPLVNDINSVVKLINEEKEVKEYFTGFGESLTATNTMDFSNRTGYLDTQISKNVQYRVISSIKAGATYFLAERFSGLQSYLEETAFDLTTVTSTAWELTPFSFLVDYFVNIGDIISSSISPVSALNWTSHSVIREVVVTQQLLSSTPVPGPFRNFASNNASASFVTRHRRIKRETLTSSIPPLVFTIPGSNTKLANIAALVASKLAFANSRPG